MEDLLVTLSALCIGIGTICVMIHPIFTKCRSTYPTTDEDVRFIAFSWSFGIYIVCTPMLALVSLFTSHNITDASWILALWAFAIIYVFLFTTSDDSS